MREILQIDTQGQSNTIVIDSVLNLKQENVHLKQIVKGSQHLPKLKSINTDKDIDASTAITKTEITKHQKKSPSPVRKTGKHGTLDSVAEGMQAQETPNKGGLV